MPMYIAPADATLGESEWRPFVEATGFGHLVAAGRHRDVPVVVPTQFVLEGDTVRLHLVRTNPFFEAIGENPRVLLSVAGDWAFIPSAWKAVGDEDPELGIPTTYYSQYQAAGVFGDKVSEAAYGEALKRWTALGATLVEFDLEPLYETARLLYEGPWVAERYLVIRDLLASSPDAIHPVTREITIAGARLSAADTFAALYRLQGLRSRDVAGGLVELCGRAPCVGLERRGFDAREHLAAPHVRACLHADPDEPTALEKGEVRLALRGDQARREDGARQWPVTHRPHRDPMRRRVRRGLRGGHTGCSLRAAREQPRDRQRPGKRHRARSSRQCHVTLSKSRG